MARVQALQRRQLWLEGALWGFAGAVAFVAVSGLVGSRWPALGRSALLLAPVGFALGLCWRGIVTSLTRVGDERRTARLIRDRLPALSFDVLAAIELRRQLSNKAAFSHELAAEFLRQVDERAATSNPRAAMDRRPLGRALAVAAVACLVAAVTVAVDARSWTAGLKASLARRERAEAARREPITGDVELTYRYPAYTGLAPRVVTGTSGEVAAPAGTELSLRTRADRPTPRAALRVNGKALPLRVADERDLSGSFVVDQPGHYVFVFQDEDEQPTAEGPPIAINVQTDAAPQVRLLSPEDELEVNPDDKVTLRFEAQDDYGLAGLELVFKAQAGEEQRLPLKHDEGRRASGQYAWDMAGLKLSPGQRVTYFLEAKDNDTVAGSKKGASRTLALRLYSAAEHRREAVRRAEELWERLVLHLGDRLEGPDRAQDKELTRISAAKATDESGKLLASDLREASHELLKDRDAPAELCAALANIGDSLAKTVRVTTETRRAYLRLARSVAALGEPGRRLAAATTTEIGGTERDVLYLESLLDRQKMQDLRELAEQLQKERRQLASAIEQYRQTQDEKLKEQILGDVNAMRARIAELMQRMGELAKGIRDEHLNQEALKELMEERDMNSALDDVEKLMREGKADEALAKLQELGMQMEEMLQSLEEGAETAGAEQYPELAKKFQEFSDQLEKTTDEQKKTADETRELRDRYKEQLKEQLSRRGTQLKDELARRAEEVAKDYQKLSPDELSSRADRPLEEALAELENLRNALKVEDYDLAAEAAARAEQAARNLAQQGHNQRQLDEIFQNPADVRRQSRDLAERLDRNARKVDDINQKLQSLFPQPGSMLSEADRQRLRQLSQKQRDLEGQSATLRGQMEELAEMAPVFGDEALQQMDQIGERMGEAAQRMEMRDPSRGFGEQKAALDQLEQLKKQMQEAGSGRGKGRGLPLPMMAGRREGNWGQHREKIEIPDEDPAQAPKEFRRDLLEAMKQSSPDKYKEQVKRFYEELVK